MAEYEGVAIYPWWLAIALVLSFITLAFGLSIKFLIEEYSPVVALAAFSILFITLTLPAWINTLFRKLVVDEGGITLKRSLNFKIPHLYEFDLFYPFEDIEWIKAKGIFVDIKGKSLFTNPRWILVQNSKGLIRAVKKYAPELVTNYGCE